jgi:hypothetical protein
VEIFVPRKINQSGNVGRSEFPRERGQRLAAIADSVRTEISAAPNNLSNPFDQLCVARW